MNEPVDIVGLRALLAAVPNRVDWRHGPVSAAINTDPSDGAPDALFTPWPSDRPWYSEDHPADDVTIAKAALACAAVNALPKLLAVYEATMRFRGNSVEAVNHAAEWLEQNAREQGGPAITLENEANLQMLCAAVIGLYRRQRVVEAALELVDSWRATSDDAQILQERASERLIIEVDEGRKADL